MQVLVLLLFLGEQMETVMSTHFSSPTEANSVASTRCQGNVLQISG